MIRIRIARTDAEIRRCFRVMSQLRPKLTEKAFIRRVRRFDAHRFYLRKRMRISSHHFSLPLSD